MKSLKQKHRRTFWKMKNSKIWKISKIERTRNVCDANAMKRRIMLQFWKIIYFNNKNAEYCQLKQKQTEFKIQRKKRSNETMQISHDLKNYMKITTEKWNSTRIFVKRMQRDSFTNWLRKTYEKLNIRVVTKRFFCDDLMKIKLINQQTTTNDKHTKKICCEHAMLD